MSTQDIDEIIQAAPESADGTSKALKKRGRPKTKAVLAPIEDEEPAIPVWFGRRQKINGRSQVHVNEVTDETDVLSLAIHSGIATDEALSEFMLDDATLKLLASATKAALSHSAKLTGNPDNTIVTRYYAAGVPVPETPDPRVGYRPSPEDKPSRWAVRGYLIATVCSLLDDSQRVRVLGEKGSPADPEANTTGSTMVTFRGQRRDLMSIPLPLIEEAERDVMTSHGVALMRELICIRRMLHTNSEKGLMKQCAKIREAEGLVRAEKMIRITEIASLTAEKDREIAARTLEIVAVKADRERVVEAMRGRTAFRAEEASARLALVIAYDDGVIHMMWRLSTLAVRSVPLVMTIPLRRQEDSQPADELSALRLELEDAKLEIARLKDDARGKAVPKPRAHRKVKDPDLHLATEADIKSSVRAHLSQQGSGTPQSSVGSRARRRVGLPSGSPGGMTPVSSADLRAQEEKEIESARKLKALSRSREQDLCNAESSSEQLGDIIEALSSILTKITLTIEDVAARRTAILNHMRSLAMHSRSIASIIRERPYLLGLARRMNHERRPVVNLGSLRALINVAASNFKSLKEIETITLESVGGVFDVMSLEEAAESAIIAAREEEAWGGGVETVVNIPDTPVTRQTPPQSGVLMRATLRRPNGGVSKTHRGDGNVSGAETSSDSDSD